MGKKMSDNGIFGIFGIFAILNLRTLHMHCAVRLPQTVAISWPPVITYFYCLLCTLPLQKTLQMHSSRILCCLVTDSLYFFRQYFNIFLRYCKFMLRAVVLKCNLVKIIAMLNIHMNIFKRKKEIKNPRLKNSPKQNKCRN